MKLSNQTIDPNLFTLLCTFFGGRGRLFQALHGLTEARVAVAVACNNIMVLKKGSQDLIRAAKELEVHSNILRDAIHNYNQSLDIIEDQLKTELGQAREQPKNPFRFAERELPPRRQPNLNIAVDIGEG